MFYLYGKGVDPWMSFFDVVLSVHCFLEFLETLLNVSNSQFILTVVGYPQQQVSMQTIPPIAFGTGTQVLKCGVLCIIVLVVSVSLYVLKLI